MMQQVKLKNSFWSWFQIIRPKTLTAAFIPFVDGALLAYSRGYSINYGLLLSALLTAMCVQIGSNLINDAADFEKGADTAERLGPKRAAQSGMATSRQIYYAGLAAFVLALLTALPLIWQGGIILLLVILASMAAAYGYTAGPLPLAYLGYGDFFVLIFFGWVATAAGYWIHSHVLDLPCFVLGTQIGLLCMVIIAVNNLRDIAEDKKAHKRTLAVRWGITFARWEITAAVYVPFMLGYYWLYNDHIYTATLPWFSLFLALILLKKIWSQAPSRAYNMFFGLAAFLHLVFGLLLGVGLLLD